MLAELFSVVQIAGETMLKIVPISIALAHGFPVISRW